MRYLPLYIALFCTIQCSFLPKKFTKHFTRIISPTRVHTNLHTITDSYTEYPFVKITTFAATHQTKDPQEPIIMIDPIFFKKEHLYNNPYKSIIPWLNYHGIHVILIHLERYNPNTTNLETLGTKIIPHTIQKIAAKRKERSYILMGISLGGQSVMHFIASQQVSYLRRRKNINITRVAFYNTGLDYNYEQSFYNWCLRNKYVNKNVKEIPIQKGYGEFNKKNKKFFNYIPSLETKPRVKWKKITSIKDLPMVFITSALDNLSPSESMFPLYILYGNGSDQNYYLVKKDIPRFFLTSGILMGFSKDYNHIENIWGEEIRKDMLRYLIFWMKEDLY